MEITISAGVVAMAVLELLKWIIRQFKGATYDFPPQFYVVMLPILNVAVVPLLALLGFTGFAFPTNWADWGMNLLRLALVTTIATFVSVGSYTIGFRPLKVYVREFRAGLLRPKAMKAGK